METNHQGKLSFLQCNQCNPEFDEQEGTGIHIGGMDRLTLSPISQVDRNSEYLEGTIQLYQTIDDSTVSQTGSTVKSLVMETYFISTAPKAFVFLHCCRMNIRN